MKLKLSYFQLLLLIVYFNYVKLVPDEYCIPPLNTSDCGIPPTPVFSYFKFGSRCEIEYWRGCPTANKFENEYHCSHYCIGKTKYYGRERGISIEDLSFKELEDVNRILHEIDDMSDEAKEKLDLVSPAHKPATKTTMKAQTADTKTTVDAKTEDTKTTDDAKTGDTRTTVEARTEEYESEEESDEHEKGGSTLVAMTQEPVTDLKLREKKRKKE
ncbi:uncharacterized protein LOC134792718 [Cydia splendana]|uniref:uncharacterized protein LOC134792718 n=1 Tax=Cydia splendana TaxID=1100963 RepID=UPI0028F47245